VVHEFAPLTAPLARACGSCGPPDTTPFGRREGDRGWTYRRLPNGDILWTSPLGTTYTPSGRSP
jgi:hypothetical protein